MSLRLDHTHAPAWAFPIHYNVLCVFVVLHVSKQNNHHVVGQI